MDADDLCYILSDTVWLHSNVSQWQAVGRRCRGRQDIHIHLLKPARFLPDPQYVVPPSLHDNVVQDNARVPGHDYIAYAYQLPTQSGDGLYLNPKP